MNNTKYLFLIVSFFFYPLFSAHAFMEKDLWVLNMQDGLADNTVYCIHKDKDGLMWFGTNNGLSRYDGTFFRNFNAKSWYMAVSSIQETTDGLLWVIAGEKLFCFDRYHERFIPVTLDAKSEIPVTKMLFTDDWQQWALSDNHLQRWQRSDVRDKNGTLTAVELTVDRDYAALATKHALLSSFCLSQDKKAFWLMTNQCQLIHFDLSTQQSTSRPVFKQTSEATDIYDITENRGCVWISTLAKGIICYRIDRGLFEQFTYQEAGGTKNLSHSDVYALIPLSGNSCLAATWNGYTVLNFTQDHSAEFTTDVYSNTPSQLYQNLETRMISAYYDPQGILWIGTHGGGVIAFDQRKQFYRQFHQSRHNEICGMVTDKENYIWLATFHKGIMRSDQPFVPKGKPMSFSSVKHPLVEQKTTVLCALKEGQEDLWFGNTEGTLTHYSSLTKQFSVYPLLLPNGTRSTAKVWSMLIDSRQRFWIGTDQGIFLFNSDTKRVENVSARLPKEKAEPIVRTIAEGQGASIWLGTSVGVRKLISSKGDGLELVTGFEKRGKGGGSSVRSLLASADGNLYVGYVDGLGIIAPKSDRINTFLTTHDGLCSNFIGCITEDAEGRIWLGTNAGISRYSRKLHLFYSYYISGSNRSTLLHGNTLFWGNNKSLTYFNPQEIRTNYSMQQKVRLTNLEVNNRTVHMGEKINGQLILEKGITHVDQIVLNHDNRDFALSFSNLQYAKGVQKYSCRLYPYQKEWIVTDEGNRIAYTNIPAGEYSFQVKGLFSENEKKEDTGAITALSILIGPHWSQTVAFKLGILTVLLLVLYYAYQRIRHQRWQIEHEMQLKHELLAATQEHEKEKQIRMERENFFTTAAHELRTPLTLIVSPLEELMHRSLSADLAYEKLATIHKNASSLHTLVDHLLYVQKIEAGMVKLQLSEVDIVDLVQRLSADFQSIAECERIRFVLNLPSEPIYLWMDKVKMTSAIRNLLSNAFKYTAAQGTIELTISRKSMDGNQLCLFSVRDTGMGISTELQSRIFDSFVTGEGTPFLSTKSGIGLYIVKNTMNLHHGQIILQSTPGKGSTFTLYIPEGKAHFNKDTYVLVSNEVPEETIHSTSLSPVTLPDENVSMQRKYTILLIEDNSEMRAYLHSLFQKRFQVLEAVNGEEGVRIATEKRPDMIISDVMMPVKDGFACCRELRMQSETAQIPLIMLTAKAEEADVLQGSRMGADDFMMKPFNPEILKAKVEHLIAQRERLKKIYTKALMLKQSHDTQEVGEERGEEDAFMQQVMQAIEANLSNENFNVAQLANRLNMSQTTLYRRVKQRSDLSVIEVIRSIRMSKAATLVIENRYSIQEIAERVGFNDLTTFRRHFTKQFGVPPSKYGEK